MANVRGLRYPTGLTGTPTLKDVARLTIFQLPEPLARLGVIFKAEMRRFKLGWYRHTASKTTWLGFKDAKIADHDRWLFVVPDEGVWWHRVLRESEMLSNDFKIGDLLLRALPRSPGEITQIMNRLDSLPTSMDQEVVFYDGKRLPIQLMIHYSTMFPTLLMGDILKLGDRWDVRELHELVHHFDAWVAHNPDFTGMPRHLVLRMHGLGFLGIETEQPLLHVEV